MTEEPAECICAGIVVADHVCAPIDRFPDAGQLITTSHLELTVGGCASNTATDLSRVGVRSSLVGLVGDDPLGRFVRATLEEAGVDCTHLKETSTSETSGTLIVNIRGEDRRFIHAVGASREFRGTEVEDELLRSSRVLYLGGYGLTEALSPENVAALFSRARAAGVTTVLDVVLPGPADVDELLRPVLPLTDVFLPNDSEAALLTGLSDPLEQARFFQDAGAGTVGITCGSEGVVLVSADVSLRSGVYKVDIVDGTGSGDAFVAGYIYGLLREADVEQCLRYGAALGASCVTATGASTGVFSRDELEEFVATRTLAVERA